MTKRRVQGGGATSERRRRDGVSGKSHLRGLFSLSRRRQPTHCVHWFIPPRARVSRASHAWQVRAVKGGAKVGSFTTSHDFNHTTRANISHEKAEQIRARIVCTPAESALAGVNLICALTEQSNKHYRHLIRQPTAATFSHWRRLAKCQIFRNKNVHYVYKLIFI